MKINKIVKSLTAIVGLQAALLSSPSYAWDLEDLKPLYLELLEFKDTTEFKKLGFAPASPHHDWLDRVNEFRNDKKSNQDLYFAHGFGAGDLSGLGLEYVTSKGVETDHSRYLREKMDAAFSP